MILHFFNETCGENLSLFCLWTSLYEAMTFGTAMSISDHGHKAKKRIPERLGAT